MPFDKFVDQTTLWEERRKSTLQSLRSITVEELNKIAKEHEEEFLGDPSREQFLQALAEHPHGSFYHAVPEEGLEVVYCHDVDFGIWVLPGGGMGPLDEHGKRLIREAISGWRQPA